jgi:hypothetical protein
MVVKQKGSQRWNGPMLAQESKVSFVSEIARFDTRKWSRRES